MADLSLFEYFVAGGVGGFFNVLLGYPFDTIKVRLHLSRGHYTGMVDCMNQLVRDEGLRGFFKGVSSPLSSVTPLYAIMFLSYGAGKRMFNAEAPDSKLVNHLFAGGFAGSVNAVFATPIDRVKVLLQLQRRDHETIYRGSLDCAIKLLKTGGITNLYRGAIAMWMREAPANAFYYMTYEAAKRYYRRSGETISRINTSIAGGLAGIAFWVVGLPADVIKSRLQATYHHHFPGGIRGIIYVFNDVMLHEGPKGFYKGMFPVMLRTIPSNMACFTGFEIVADGFRKRHGR